LQLGIGYKRREITGFESSGTIFYRHVSLRLHHSSLNTSQTIFIDRRNIPKERSAGLAENRKKSRNHSHFNRNLILSDMLEAISLTKTYGEHTALKGLDLTVPKGEIFCLLGQNGAGKTTTINLFLGFIQPTSGVAKVNGVEVRVNAPEAKKHLAYIPEVVMLYGNLTGTENLAFFSQLAGYKYSPDSLTGFLSKAGLQPQAHHKPLSTYSKGMRQKVGIAIALAKNAGVILMDEPTSGLDPKATAEFTATVKELAAEGKSILMATHDIFNAVNAGTRIGIMKQGELVHTVSTRGITANEVQDLYLETI
jgi:ABC-2 type transport system ATP-binding protein